MASSSAQGEGKVYKLRAVLQVKHYTVSFSKVVLRKGAIK